MNFYQRMGILPLKKRVNRDKCNFTTKQRMFGVFAIEEILRYRWTPFVGSSTLCHPVVRHSTRTKFLTLSDAVVWRPYTWRGGMKQPPHMYVLNFAPLTPNFHLKTTPNYLQHAKGDTYFADFQLLTDWKWISGNIFLLDSSWPPTKGDVWRKEWFKLLQANI